MTGRTILALRRDRQPLLTRCSLFHKNSALSTTWKWSESRHLLKLLNKNKNIRMVKINLPQLVRSQQLQDLLQLIKEEDLLRTATPRPAPEEARQDTYCCVGIFLDVLNDAIAELLVVQRHALGLMQRN